jgi:ankyrin repeat protein
METLDLNSLSIICLYLPHQSLTLLAISSVILSKNMCAIHKNNLFWKKYVEIFLSGGKELTTKKSLKERNANWQGIYNIINELYVNWEIANMDISIMDKNNFETDDEIIEIKNIKDADLFESIGDIESYFDKDDILQTIYVLMESEYDPFVGNNAVLKISLNLGFFDIVELLLKDSRIDPRFDNCYLFKHVFKYGYENIIKIFMEDSRINTPLNCEFFLILAFKYEQFKILQLLLKDGMVNFDHIKIFISSAPVEMLKILSKDSRIDTLLTDTNIIQSAISRKNVNFVKLLLINPNIKLSQQNIDNIIWYACQFKNTEILKLLLTDLRYDPSVDNNSAFIDAAKNGRTNVIKLLLEDKRVDPCANNGKAIIEAVRFDHIDIVKLLLKDKKVEMTMYTVGLFQSSLANNVFIDAVQYNRINIVKLLLKDGRYDPSVERNFAIRWAALYNRINIVKLLLEDRRVNSPYSKTDIYELFISAIKGGWTDIVELLLKEEILDPSESNNDAIMIAAENNNVDIVELLLSDPRINPFDFHDYIGTKSYKHIKIVKLLLADSRFTLNCGAIMFQYACSDQLTKIVRLLLKDSRIDPSKSDNYCINYASKNGHTKIVKILIKHPRVNPSDNHNYAIKQSCKYGHINIVKLLLKDDRVDPFIDNYAIKNALKKGHDEILKLLQNKAESLGKIIQF